MLQIQKALPLVLLLGATMACESGRHSSAGFRLPADGDVGRGTATFVALGCHSCHAVAGADLPRPAAEHSAPVVLGGLTTKQVTDGYLVTSIINPSHRPSAQAKGAIRPVVMTMPDYTDKLTVRQLTDLVAFLQSRYELRHPTRFEGYY
jgi:L-cysteine S-thiosulfotransferase